jgi:predicted amidophosphoribosyltransferase
LRQTGEDLLCDACRDRVEDRVCERCDKPISLHSSWITDRGVPDGHVNYLGGATCPHGEAGG